MSGKHNHDFEARNRLSDSVRGKHITEERSRSAVANFLYLNEDSRPIRRLELGALPIAVRGRKGIRLLERIGSNARRSRGPATKSPAVGHGQLVGQYERGSPNTFSPT